MFNASLFSNIRFYVLVFSVFLSIGVYFWITNTILESGLQIIRLTQTYALTAVSFLYLALIIGPVVYTFRFLPFRGQITKARRAIGVSVFYFSILHVYFSFFKLLGGFSGLPFLPSNYLLAIALSFTALIILFLMAITSFDAMVEKLTFPRWKLLHRFVYLASIFILIHALMLGTHFQDLSSTIPQIFSVALFFLLFLEANRFDNFLQTKFPNFYLSKPTLFILIISAIIYVLYKFFTLAILLE